MTEQVEIYFEEMPENVGETQVRAGHQFYLSEFLTEKRKDGWRFCGLIASMDGQLCMFERLSK